MKRSSLLIRTISVILVLTFIAGQIQADQISSSPSSNTLAASVVSDSDINPARSKPVQNDIAGKAEPGAIGNGIPLMELSQGKLPPRIVMQDDAAAKIREVINIAIKHCIVNERNIPPAHISRFKQAMANLVELQNRLNDRAYLYNAVVRTPEDYLVGFNFEGKTGLSIELINRLYLISPIRLAQYIFHECIPEKGIITERDDHRAVYNEIQSAVFGQDEVLALKKDLRGFINERVARTPAPVQAQRIPSLESAISELRNTVAYVLSDSEVQLLNPSGTTENYGNRVVIKITNPIDTTKTKEIRISKRQIMPTDMPTFEVMVIHNNTVTSDKETKVLLELGGLVKETLSREKSFTEWQEWVKAANVVRSFPELAQAAPGLRGAIVGILSDTEVGELMPTVIPAFGGSTVRIAIQNPATEKEDVIGFKLNVSEILGKQSYEITPFHNSTLYKTESTDSPAEFAELARGVLVNEKRFAMWQEWLAAIRIVKALAPFKTELVKADSTLAAAAEVILTDSDIRELSPSVKVEFDGKWLTVSCANPKDAKDVRGFRLIAKRIGTETSFSITSFHNNTFYHETFAKDPESFKKSVRQVLGEDKKYSYWQEWVGIARAGKVTETGEIPGKAEGKTARPEAQMPIPSLDDTELILRELTSKITAAGKMPGEMLVSREEPFRTVFESAANAKVMSLIQQSPKGSNLMRIVTTAFLDENSASGVDIKAVREKFLDALKNATSQDAAIAAAAVPDLFGSITGSEGSIVSGLAVMLNAAASGEDYTKVQLRSAKQIEPFRTVFLVIANVKALSLLMRSQSKGSTLTRIVTTAFLDENSASGVDIGKVKEEALQALKEAKPQDAAIAAVTVRELFGSITGPEGSIVSGLAVMLNVAANGEDYTKVQLSSRHQAGKNPEEEILAKFPQLRSLAEDYRRAAVAVLSDLLKFKGLEPFIFITVADTGVRGCIISIKNPASPEDSISLSIEYDTIGKILKGGGNYCLGYVWFRTTSIRQGAPSVTENPVEMPTLALKVLQELKQTQEWNALLAAVATAALAQKLTEDLPVRAKVFAANLIQILAKNPDQLFFIGIETDIGESQKAQIMPIYKAIDQIENMTDSAGKRLFPNLMVRRAKAAELVTMVADLNKEERLNLNNAFIGARKVSVDNKIYDAIKGEGRSWISAIDDSRPGDYLPVFEAITLNMMAYLNADLTAIKNFYDAISEKPIDPGVLQDMLKNRIIYILPKATAFDTKQLRELYELAHQVYIAA